MAINAKQPDAQTRPVDFTKESLVAPPEQSIEPLSLDLLSRVVAYIKHSYPPHKSESLLKRLETIARLEGGEN